MLLNRKLFTDEKEVKIAQLKIAIDKFKEYDEKRKQYYKSALQELGELKSYVQELESGECVQKLKNKIKQQSENIKRLNKLVQYSKINTDITDEEISEAISISTLRTQNKKLRKELKNLKNANNMLVYKIQSLTNQQDKQ